MTVLWNVKPCSLIQICAHFWGAMVKKFRTARRYLSEDRLMKISNLT